jgi:4-alpha-glucanotransferase
VLLHPTSLPSRYGIGDLGSAASQFLDYLNRAKQRLWQVLPLGPTGYGDSPYASPSAFAGNTLLIAPELLIQEGLLESGDVEPLRRLPEDRVVFGELQPLKRQLLEKAFRSEKRQLTQDRLEAFKRAQAAWLDDFALFTALTEQHGHWLDWPPPLRDREPAALEQARHELHEQIDLHTFAQFLFFDQWHALRARANQLGISIIGDIPIFVAHESADVWAHRHLFKLDDQGRPTVVAGVPPDYFSATGQLWGNPLYDWHAIARDGYQWWIARMRHLLELVDIVRIDHFRGFEAAWEVPANAATAVHGTWVRGAGKDVFDAIDRALGGHMPVIAEDLGLITDEVRELLAQTGYPGMKVLQFAFGGGSDNPYLPHNYTHPNCVVYTGTHDNDTSRGWFTSLSDPERHSLLRYLGDTSSGIACALTRLALASIADTAIVPLQDVLDLGSEARMNVPGSVGGSWMWRVRADQLDLARADNLAELTHIYGRS